MRVIDIGQAGGHAQRLQVLDIGVDDAVPGRIGVQEFDLQRLALGILAQPVRADRPAGIVQQFGRLAQIGAVKLRRARHRRLDRIVGQD